MRGTDIKEFVEKLGTKLPPIENFWKLGDLTALRLNENGHFYQANYERGILLYALVAKYRPQAVLEFGTGRGYGCLCMAWAMEEHNISGRIFTIDMVPQDEVFAWPIDWRNGPRVERLARNQVWLHAAPAAWLKRIEILTGHTGNVMGRWSGPGIDFAFIDGGHAYDTVRHDFYSVLEVAADPFGVLFDDYAQQPGFGIQRFIDEEVAPHFKAELIYTDRRWPGAERAELKDPEYGMVWVHSDSLSKPLGEIYLKEPRQAFLRKYRRREIWALLRRCLSRVLRGIAG